MTQRQAPGPPRKSTAMSSKQPPAWSAEDMALLEKYLAPLAFVRLDDLHDGPVYSVQVRGGEKVIISAPEHPGEGGWFYEITYVWELTPFSRAEPIALMRDEELVARVVHGLVADGGIDLES